MPATKCSDQMEVPSLALMQNKENPGQNQRRNLECPSDAPSQEDTSVWRPSVNESQTQEESSRQISACASSSALRPDGSSKSARTDAEKMHAMGYEARKKGDYRTAVTMYTKAIGMCEGFFKAYFNRGFAYDKLCEYDRAISDYSKALELEPKNAYVYYNRGVSLDKLQRFDEAIYNFSMAITLEPNKADFYHNRGFAFRKKLEYEKAIQDYSKALVLSPGHFKAHYNKAACFEKMGKLREAEQSYEEALRIQPGNVNALHYLATVQEKIGGPKLQTAYSNFSLYFFATRLWVERSSSRRGSRQLTAEEGWC